MEGTLTYEELLEVKDEDQFKELLIARLELKRAQLLKEMIEHESRTNSAEKSLLGRETNPETRMVLDVFHPEKSEHVVSLMDRLNEHTEIDLVLHAIFAKAASDRGHLGTQQEFRIFTNEK